MGRIYSYTGNPVEQIQTLEKDADLFGFESLGIKACHFRLTDGGFARKIDLPTSCGSRSNSRNRIQNRMRGDRIGGFTVGIAISYKVLNLPIGCFGA